MKRKPKKKVGAKPKKKQAKPWEISRVLDERTGAVLVGASYRNTLYGRQFAVFPAETRDTATALRKALMAAGADLSGNKSAQLKFVEKLLNQSPKTYRLPKSPGFRDQATGFVLGTKMFGTAKGLFKLPTAFGGIALGQSRGNLKSWNADVAGPLQQSSFGSVAVMVALAAPLIGYNRGIIEKTRKGAPIVPESFTLNFSGVSASGKTMVCMAAASVLGPPENLAKWDFSRAGLERLCEEANDLPLMLDDTEKLVEEGGLKLKSAISLVTQYVAGKQSKALAQIAHETTSPQRNWSTMGLSSSPIPVDSIAAAGKWSRSLGERVRFINISIPFPEVGGVFDQVASGRGLAAASKKLADKLVHGMTHNYGVVFHDWIELLLDNELAGTVTENVEYFVSQLPDVEGSYRQRLARKFGLLYAAGQIATDHGIVAWPKDWPLKAVSKVYGLAAQEIFAEEYAAKKKLRILRKLTKNAARFPLAQSTAAPVKFSDKTLGLRCTLKGKKVCGIRDEDLRRFTGGDLIADGLLGILRKVGAIESGQGHASTKQLPYKVKLVGGGVVRPRFHVIRLKKLYELKIG